MDWSLTILLVLLMLLSGSEKQVMVEQNVEITRCLWLTVNETKAFTHL